MIDYFGVVVVLIGVIDCFLDVIVWDFYMIIVGVVGIC